MYRVLTPNGSNPQVNGKVGFDSLPDQVVNKAIAKGFRFNILCVGETGIGKSTLLDTLFKADLADTQHMGRTPGVTLEEHSYNLKESQVNLNLTIVDTVGYGDHIERTDSAQPVVEYIEKQFEGYLQEELRIQRNLQQYQDTRIHVCIYFISPTGHTLKALDIACMKELQSRVNIIPVISKADTIAKNEMARFKERILQDLKQHDINIYRFPTDDKTVAKINEQMNAIVPFAVIGSRDEIEVNGQRVRARLYPWGTVEVENEAHCDFIQLREMLIRTNMDDLIDTTHQVHYETYRKEALRKMGFYNETEDSSGKPARLSDLIEEKRQEHVKELEKAEEEMKQRFISKVSEVETKLKKEERELQDGFDVLKKSIAENKKRMEEQRRVLEDEIASFHKHRSDMQLAQAQAAKEAIMDKRKK